MSKIISPHDRFFKRSMANIRVAQDFFTHYLPAEVLARVNLNTLQLRQTSFIDEHLGASAADILYSIQFDGRPGYFYLLSEHQSEPDKLLPFRVEGYKWEIMQQHLDQTGDKVLPIVYALVFYNGKKAYNYSTDILDLFEDRVLAEATLFKPFQLIKVRDVADEEISRYKWSGLMELVAKHIHDKDMLPYLNQIGQHIQNLQGEGFGEYEYFVLIFQYIACAGNIQDKQIFADTVKRVLPTKAGEEIMTIVEMYKQEGLQEGLHRGKQEGLQEGHFEEKIEIAKKLLSKGSDINTISEITELPRNKIEELKNQVLH